ncbi:VOC family protein [Streptomyces sp. NPDC014006]|uniref:VOC family protein n=1 Tax=Streptomyces sp. NPDC014006 TaxID=3364870 RepID=UPI0037030A26
MNPNPHLRTLHHICIVAIDLDRAVAYYESLGVGPWYDYPKSTAYKEFEVPSREASAAMRYKCANLDNVQLQLCKPPELDCPQRRFLDEHGEGVHHLGFETPDLTDARAHAGRLGLGVLAPGRRADGSGFCYFDTREGAGVVLEVRRTQR